MSDTFSADMLAEAKRLAAESSPRIRPVGGEYYVGIVPEATWYEWSQMAWRSALDRAKRQLGRLRYW